MPVSQRQTTEKLNFRKIHFWLHLGRDLLAGIVVFIKSVTGVLFT